MSMCLFVRNIAILGYSLCGRQLAKKALFFVCYYWPRFYLFEQKQAVYERQRNKVRFIEAFVRATDQQLYYAYLTLCKNNANNHYLRDKFVIVSQSFYN